jgi:hypothetical protein
VDQGAARFHTCVAPAFVQTTLAPEPCYKETIGVRCGTTGESNYAYIADGQRFLARNAGQTEAAFLQSCEALCSSSSECGGFNLILAGAPFSGGPFESPAGLGTCWFRHDATVGVRSDSERNCYVRQQDCTNSDFNDALALFSTWGRAQRDEFLALAGETCGARRRLLSENAAASDFEVDNDKTSGGALYFETGTIGAFVAVAALVVALAAAAKRAKTSKMLAAPMVNAKTLDCVA